jgi:hypothetical protein
VAAVTALLRASKVWVHEQVGAPHGRGQGGGRECTPPPPPPPPTTLLTARAQHFADAVAHVVKHKAFPGDGGSAAVTVAELNAGSGGGGGGGGGKAIIGAIVVSAVNAHAARERGDIPFQLLASESATSDLAIVKGMAVDRTQRRRGVGTELLYTGVRAVAADPRVQAVRGWREGGGGDWPTLHQSAGLVGAPAQHATPGRPPLFLQRSLYPENLRRRSVSCPPCTATRHPHVARSPPSSPPSHPLAPVAGVGVDAGG